MSSFPSKPENFMSSDEEIVRGPPASDELQDGTESADMTGCGEDAIVDVDNGPYASFDVELDDEAGDVPAEKRFRKMTSNSDATSATAASSVEDGTGDDNDFVSKDPKPALDALHETSEDDSSSEGLPLECRCLIWFKRIFLFLVVFSVLGFAVVMIGARLEKNKFEIAEGTEHLYQTPQVCGVHDPLVDAMGITYNSVQEAHANGAQVAHCGECGSCSSAHDMEIMARTADSLTKDSTRCAFKIFIGRHAVKKCMEESVGFTPACEDCWTDNISCSFKACKFTCIKYKLFRQTNNNKQELNDCLKCDERMCGQDFVECSGSNRRRMKIVSDIERNAETEQCKNADVDWHRLFGH